MTLFEVRNNANGICRLRSYLTRPEKIVVQGVKFLFEEMRSKARLVFLRVGENGSSSR